uniref:Metalloendopeptidase n=1 Tax=Colubraria reticulata TaxID=604273 RepID=A0A481SNP7_9CAEN|nr:CreM12-ShK6 [Colubraria reticulata]
MTVLVCLLAIGLLFVGGDAYTRDHRPTSVDEAIMLAAGKNAYMRRSGNMYRDGMDMVITREQRRALYGPRNSRQRNQGLPYAMTPWTNGIVPYTIMGPFDQQRLVKINEAMKAWEQVSCVKFRQATDNDKNRIHISNSVGCWAHLGMLQTYVQYMSLQANGCFWRGTVEHEFGHALGLVHEHQRPNRDNYVRVNEANIQHLFRDQLSKYVSTLGKMGLPYDYQSVMHYGQYAFSIQPEDQHPTVHAFGRSQEENERITGDLGRVLGPSFIDAKLVNLLYNCAKRCTRPPQCRSDCFVTHDCKCICKETMPPVLCYDSSHRCSRITDRDCVAYLDFQWEYEIYCRKRCKMCAVNGTLLPPDTPALACQDFADTCKMLRIDGRCSKDTEYMNKHCPKSCKLCTVEGEEEDDCEDLHASCRSWAIGGQCNDERIMNTCKKSCTGCDGENVNDVCENTNDEKCARWAKDGQCTKGTSAYMKTNCRKACKLCGGETGKEDENGGNGKDDNGGNGKDENGGNGKEDGACKDNDQRCNGWANRGECNGNSRNYMMKHCKKACNKCDGGGGKEEEACEDKHEDCADWAEGNQCTVNPEYMLTNCKKSCTKCGGGKEKEACEDKHEDCADWAEGNQCTVNPSYMLTNCKKSCTKCGGGKEKAKCQNLHDSCEGWAKNEQCTRNPSYMESECRKACNLC